VLKFQAVAEKTAKKLEGATFLPHPVEHTIKPSRPTLKLLCAAEKEKNDTIFICFH